MNFYIKGGFKSEDTGKFLGLQHKYSKSLSWAENLNKLFTVVGGKFKFSAQDSDLEYLFWQRKNSPVSSDLHWIFLSSTICKKYIYKKMRHNFWANFSHFDSSDSTVGPMFTWLHDDAYESLILVINFL